MDTNKKIQNFKNKQEKFRLVYNDLVTNNSDKEIRKAMYAKIIEIEKQIYSLQKL